ncbi:hypothetical protein OU994_16845 [Pseudoduganella sp. SL102]|uniref:hypothetical protein n=1 Tax=Pseudoduganella sp. SL102 TaxID=2995154 RepID=UPI00248BF42C|nr:hypothetical protein [Pseudoduganella sp. SL102]WBR99991.1 hypothetical protein OU994_16845 [Pseudoduganella sp. SL102]
MQGDFSVLNFDPHQHERGVDEPADGVLRNLSGVLHQQGRVMSDADLTEGELLELGWNGQAGRDIIGAGICAVPATQPEGFSVVSAVVSGGNVLVSLLPGHAWADGILTRLAGEAADPAAPVQRLASYFGPPLATPLPTPASIEDGVRDAVILEVSEESIHGFQYPQRLIEPALGGPDTSERAFVNFRIRLLRLEPGEDCLSIRGRLADDPASKGRLTASLAPVVAIAGDCPVVGGGGYTGFEHNLYRIEVADVPPATPPRFKWSQWNGGLVGRGRFETGTNPDRIILDAGRAPIVHSGLTEFYLEALEYDELIGAWQVVYGTLATLNTDHDLELAAPATFGTLPATTEPVFIRLWNGIANIADFPDVANPAELRDGIRLAFDAPAAGNYRPGDYWTFTVRAGEIANPQVLVDDAPPTGIVYHRVPLAELNWTGPRNNFMPVIEDCRHRFGALTRKTCCTFLIGDGVRTFGDFNSLEVAAMHLPAAGGELCLLPGLHRANLRLEGRRDITIHGCSRRTAILPRTETRFQPILHFVDCSGIRVHTVDLLTLDGIDILVDASRDVRIDATRMLGRLHCIRANASAGLHIDNNRLHLLDTAEGLTTISLEADDSLVERNTLVLLPFTDRPDRPDGPDDDPTRDPADPCARPEVLYRHPHLVLAYAQLAWTYVLALLVLRQPYRALGGIHLRVGCERVRLLENEITGGAGDGIVLGGDLDPPPPPNPEPVPDDDPPVAVDAGERGQFRGLVQDEAGTALAGVAVYVGPTVDEARMAPSGTNGRVGIMTTPGPNLLAVAPSFRIVSVTPVPERNGILHVIVVAPRQQDRAPRARFLHEITIEANKVTLMGLSGIGFALRTGARLATGGGAAPTGTPKQNLLDYIDAALFNLALAPLLRATDPVRDLVILNNRLYRNLRNPFTDAMLEQAQEIGRGGISLAIVDSLVITGNHVTENGASAADPACGVFVGWGNDVEITDNTLTANGATTAGFEDSRRAGLRGGIYLRFAGALSEKLSASSGRKPALRVHDNRVDQPAGRALTAFAFGPVSVANNHFSSEFTGRFGFIDAAFGCVLIVNLVGIHRLIARLLGDQLENPGSYSVQAERSLPGGETIYDDNFARLDTVNRSLMSQAILCMDDVSYASNTSSVMRREPFFCNTVLIGDTVRATGGRLREEAVRTLSMLSLGLRGNMTALNQADHCIFAFPPRTGPHVPQTVDAPNHIFDPSFCRNAAGGQTTVGTFAAPALAAHAGQLGGTVEADALPERELAPLARRYTVESVTHVATTQAALTRAYQAETLHLEAKLGADHPKVLEVKTQTEASMATLQVLAVSSAAVAPQAPPDGKGSSLGGRLVDAADQGQPGYRIELADARGAPVANVGVTDGNGNFATTFDGEETARLAGLGMLLPRVLDDTGKVVLTSREGVTLAPGADVRLWLVLPRAPGRTALGKLKLDAALEQQLRKGGIDDVEEILETDKDVLAELAGGVDAAEQLIALARRILG